MLSSNQLGIISLFYVYFDTRTTNENIECGRLNKLFCCVITGGKIKFEIVVYLRMFNYTSNGINVFFFLFVF